MQTLDGFEYRDGMTLYDIDAETLELIAFEDCQFPRGEFYPLRATLDGDRDVFDYEPSSLYADPKLARLAAVTRLREERRKLSESIQQLEREVGPAFEYTINAWYGGVCRGRVVEAHTLEGALKKVEDLIKQNPTQLVAVR